MPTTRRPWRLLLALLCAGVLTLAACGGGGDDSSDDDGDRHNEASSDELEDYQDDLEAVGCWSGPVDGDLSTKTEAAIREFQQAEGLDVDGQLSDETEEALQKAADDGRTVCNADDGRSTDEASVHELEVWQHDLNVVGCWAGPVDGRLGPQTEAAIRAFQQAANLPVDGQLSQATEDALASDAAQGALICETPGHRNDGRSGGGGSTTTTTARPTTTTTASSSTSSSSSSSTTSTSTTSTTQPSQDRFEVRSGDPFTSRSDAQDRLDAIDALDPPVTGFEIQQQSDGDYLVVDPDPLSEDDADDIADQLTSNGIPASVKKITS